MMRARSLPAPLPLLDLHRDPDGTERLLLQRHRGDGVECVVMPAGDRTTVCVSSQIGCPVGCRFCASGLNGLGRNLSRDEIVAQVLAASRRKVPPVRSVVFMGTGEPLLNARAVADAVVRLQELGIGRKRMRVSTVGIRRGLERLASLTAPPGLALSLHAARDDLRRQLIPFSTGTVREVTRAALDYGRQARVRIAVQYVLLDGINDSAEDARALRDLFRGQRVKIDLIQFNRVEELPFCATSPEREQRFAETLYQAGIQVTRRSSRGQESRAACGQLRRMLSQGP